ncbi:unnamed protein product [Malus baccata var. baccata]
MNMGLVGKLVWVNASSRKHCRSLFWRVRAALRKAIKNSGKQRLRTFQYDPSSYALNFDDGSWKSGEGGANAAFKHARPQHHSDSDICSSGWVYILWVISE